MPDYVIMTDSSCDLPSSTITEFEISYVPLSTQIASGVYKNFLDNSGVDIKWFYEKLRAKQPASTSAPNVADFTTEMERYLKDGVDILYLGFSTGLSATYSSAKIAADELRERYPERKIYTVDTLCASLGEGLIVYLAAQRRGEGASIEEVRDFAEQNKLHLCHWFTVDDLFFLKRGGRVSAASAVVGSMLGIKPVLHVDNDGKLINMEKVRGRRRSLQRLAEKAFELGIDIKNQTVFISHGDCIEDAIYLSDLLKEAGVAGTFINYIGPVIGSHSGPGTIAMFFLGTER